MAIHGSKKGTMFDEINITPLTDIFLVLLIIMMVMAPMFQSVDKNIKMPKINSGLNVPDENVTVSITKNAEFFVDGTAVNPADLGNKLASVGQSSGKKLVVVKADSATKSREIMKVLTAAQGAGYEKLTVAGEPLSMEQQQQLTEKVKPQ